LRESLLRPYGEDVYFEIQAQLREFLNEPSIKMQPRHVIRNGADQKLPVTRLADSWDLLCRRFYRM
jgi:hypothetical protein